MWKHRLTWSLLLFAFNAGCVAVDGARRDVEFRSQDGTRLRGTIVLPDAAARPVPGVLVLHGSEAGTRDRMVYKMTANIFLSRGMAVLLVDKRGAGESEGDVATTTYAQLVDDYVAALSTLREADGVDPARVGVYGVSESGWLTPEMAERAGGLAFVINKVGSPLSFRETVAWEIFNDLVADGVDPESARQQAAIRRRIWEHLLTPDEAERERIESVLAEWAGRADSHLPERLEERTADEVADIGYDPGPFLERTTTPMLYVYGSEDINIPTAKSVERLRELSKTGRPLTFHVYEGEGHELGGPTLRPPFYGMVDGFAELVGSFAERHVAADG